MSIPFHSIRLKCQLLVPHSLCCGKIKIKRREEGWRERERERERERFEKRFMA